MLFDWGGNLRFALCTDIPTESHGNGAGSELGQTTQDDDFCVTECGQACTERKWHGQPIR